MRTEVMAAVAVAMVGAALPARAVVLCQKKSGALFLRDACKRKETQVDPTTFGATGATGATGPTGPAGPSGQPGSGGGGGTKLDFRAAASTPSTMLFDSGKLQITASCDGTGALSLIATTTVDHATVYSYGNGADFISDDF